MPDVEEVSDSEEEKKEEEEDEEEKKAEKKQEKPAEEEEEDEEPAERDADGWLDLMSGKIKMRTIKAGSGRGPEMKDSALCSVEIFAVGENDGKSLVTYPEIRYCIGEHEAVPMLELSLRHMKEGEEAELFGMPSMAWGSVGLKAASPDEQEIPGDANIKMKVRLIEVIPVRDEEPPWNELINTVSWRKFNGNDHFKRKDFKKAENCYKNGIEVFAPRGFDPPDSMRATDRPTAKAMAMNMVCDLGSNLAQVYLELDDAVKAKETALASLETRPEHLKCIFRAAKACLLLDDFDECDGLLERGFKIESENAGLKKVEADLNKKRRKYEAKSKRIAETNLFGELEYPDLVTEKREREAQEDYEETWSFWIKKEMDTWFTKKIIAVVVAFSMMLVVVLMLLPKRYWPLGLIGYVMGVPSTIGVISATDDEKREKEKDEKNKRKKKKA